MYCLPSFHMCLDILLKCQKRWWVKNLPGMHFWPKHFCDIVRRRLKYKSYGLLLGAAQRQCALRCDVNTISHASVRHEGPERRRRS